jgi:hypothetical protein
MLGYSSKNIYIYEMVEQIQKYYKNKDSQSIIKDIVSKIGRKRILNLKKSITDIQRFIYKIKYQFEDKEELEKEQDVFEDKFLENYMKKLEKIKIKDIKGKNTVLREWKIPFYNLFFQTLENKTVNLNTESKYLSVDDFNLYDYHGNIILYYIVRELSKLLEYNTDRFIKLNTAYFIINIINNLFSSFNKEDRITNHEIKRFYQILNSYTYMHDVTESGHGLGGKTEGFYGEHTDEGDILDEDDINKLEDNIQEAESLDIEGELDYEIDYQPGLNVST